MKNQNILKVFVSGVAALSLAACGGNTAVKDGSDGVNTLLDIVAVAAGSTCAEGGYTVNAGTDTNGDGVLDADEVTSSSTVCTGSDGSDGDVGSDGSDSFVSLVEQTELPVGDENCPDSGVRLDVGLDDGDGAGVAGDGILQAGEVDDSTFVCTGSNTIATKPVTPPEGPVGAFTINAEGGEGSDGLGGDGGSLGASMSPGSLTGHIKIFSTGVADASFDFPDAIQTYLGSEPLVVDGPMTLKSYAAGDHTGAADNEYHLHDNDYAIYRLDDVDGDIRVTGVKVNATKTLTFENNFASGVRVTVYKDFSNAGTLTTTLTGLDRGDLTIYCDTYHGEEGSMINLRGEDTAEADTTGGNGGFLNIYAGDDEFDELEQNWGAIYTHTQVDSSGGEGHDGGDAGHIYFSASQLVYNSGDLSANGGRGLVNNGGDAQYVELYAKYGSALNSGKLSSNGGSGAVRGGRGEDVVMDIDHAGHIKNTGDLSADGGDVDAACTTGCVGGAGGSVSLYEYGADITTSGNLSAAGGFGAAGVAGVGGTIELYGEPADGWYGASHPLGDIIISGNLNVSGGSGAEGGSAGYLAVCIEGDHSAQGPEIIFLGYTDLLLAGGDGTTLGGKGGYVQMYQDESDLNEEDPNFSLSSSGGLVNYANIDAQGGLATAGKGGSAGYFQMETEHVYGSRTDGEVALNFGDLNLLGGAGTTSGGMGGGVFLWGYNRVENHGAIMAEGGDCSADACTAGSVSKNATEFFSDLGPVISTGDISLGGGDATGAGATIGGRAGSVEIVGYSVEISGALSCTGGSANTAAGTAGAAGDIFVYGIFDGTTSSATYNVDPGEGSDDGVHGEVIIDGMNMTDTWYTP